MICVLNVVTTFMIISITILVGLLKYLPRHLTVMQIRAIYYLWGSEEDGMGMMSIEHGGGGASVGWSKRFSEE